MDATRDASVPSEWLPLFIGHRVWVRPTSAPQNEPARWCELLDVWEAAHRASETGWWLLRGLVIWDNTPTVTMLAQKAYTQGIPADECTSMPLENGSTHYLWTTPFDDPPELEMRPWEWRPGVEQPQAEPETVPSDVGDQFIMF